MDQQFLAISAQKAVGRTHPPRVNRSRRGVATPGPRPTWTLLILAAFVVVTSGCTILPKPTGVTTSQAIQAEPAHALPVLSRQLTNTLPPGHSAFQLLQRADDALLWRLALIDHARSSIDAQYFIWQDDAAGNLLFDRLLRAADRGVRVRILVDDFGIAAKERSLAAITLHPNIDVRIFNPGRVRNRVGAIAELLLNFRELNRRMHNKLFLVDGSAAIVGGRNIGNPYFGLSPKYNFVDLDVLAFGPVAGELGFAFDDYWNAPQAYPGGLMSNRATPADLELIREGLTEDLGANQALLSRYPLEPMDWRATFEQLPATVKPGRAIFLQDEPLAINDTPLRLADMIEWMSEPSKSEVLMVSPYYIPVRGTLEDIENATSNGIQVRVLTASMASNNHTSAHSHYKKYRRRILDTGASLKEFSHQPSPGIRAYADVPPVKAGFISLHVKALVADRERLFVGSLNLDPRAIEINTENGLYIDSPRLAAELANWIDTLSLPENAWRVAIDEDNRLKWISATETVRRQPARGVGQRISDFFLRLLPIEKQL